MDMGLANKHVMVTGGSQGIGFACAQLFAAQGSRVTLVARNIDRLTQARQRLLDEGAKSGQVHTLAADLRDADSALQALDAAEGALGPVEVLINSAGAAQRVPVDELTPKAWHEAMQAKFFSYVHMTDPCIKRMGQRGQGQIVNIIGIGGKVASPVHLAGGAANAALMLATTGWANAYARRGVRVNGINPGQTLTGRLQGRMSALAQQHQISPEEATEQASASLPLGRFADPREVAQMVLFLCSPWSSYVTGSIIAMDGALYPVI
jgi:NAD(P)-dependent dehydrogenase (short-subunit alcohol dehydrogenase family)